MPSHVPVLESELCLISEEIDRGGARRAGAGAQEVESEGFRTCCVPWDVQLVTEHEYLVPRTDCLLIPTYWCTASIPMRAHVSALVSRGLVANHLRTTFLRSYRASVTVSNVSQEAPASTRVGHTNTDVYADCLPRRGSQCTHNWLPQQSDCVRCAFLLAQHFHGRNICSLQF